MLKFVCVCLWPCQQSWQRYSGCKKQAFRASANNVSRSIRATPVCTRTQFLRSCLAASVFMADSYDEFRKSLIPPRSVLFQHFLLRCPNVPGRLRIGNDLYLHFAVPAEGVEKQAVWYMKDLVLACFDTVKPKALRIRAAEVRKAAAETHARIWPQWSVPETEFLREPGSEEKRGVLKAAWLPTSMMLSAVVCLLSTPNGHQNIERWLSKSCGRSWNKFVLWQMNMRSWT